VSDEQKIEEGPESEDEVEGHGRVKTGLTDEGAKDDGDDDVEAHAKLKTG
jgi:hypothetical protein